MDGSSFADIIATERRHRSPFGGIFAGVLLSTILWGIIAALIWLAFHH